ncbi:hypothetical protein [Piscirickettsia salmonis]|uniref:hypothetical protein n=1 Tax=Piscirickettsia salmonis TaxID=1238 RepID=UPI0012BAD1FA|nr:hypothetical protein [Piscirickettsia salmonis]QGP57852.1 hypothetical protein PsalBI1_00398 [Piscirickettsia salmonis]
MLKASGQISYSKNRASLRLTASVGFYRHYYKLNRLKNSLANKICSIYQEKIDLLNSKERFSAAYLQYQEIRIFCLQQHESLSRMSLKLQSSRVSRHSLIQRRKKKEPKKRKPYTPSKFRQYTKELMYGKSDPCRILNDTPRSKLRGI